MDTVYLDTKNRYRWHESALEPQRHLYDWLYEAYPDVFKQWEAVFVIENEEYINEKDWT